MGSQPPSSLPSPSEAVAAQSSLSQLALTATPASFQPPSVSIHQLHFPRSSSQIPTWALGSDPLPIYSSTTPITTAVPPAPAPTTALGPCGGAQPPGVRYWGGGGWDHPPAGCNTWFPCVSAGEAGDGVLHCGGAVAAPARPSIVVAVHLRIQEAARHDTPLQRFVQRWPSSAETGQLPRLLSFVRGDSTNVGLHGPAFEGCCVFTSAVPARALLFNVQHFLGTHDDACSCSISRIIKR
jgi:hypothetical protein